MDPERSFERFHTTNWTLVGALGSDDVRRHDEAMDLLVRTYWSPVYAYLRSRGAGRDAAAELTQAFFGDVVIGRELFRRADRSRGRLRSLVLTAVKRFCIDASRPAAARAARSTVSVDQLEIEDTRLGRPGATGPDDHFSRRWALATLQEALQRCERHFRRSGRTGHWALFETRVLRPAIAGTEPPPLSDIAESSGFASAALAAAGVQVVKRRLESLLREVVAETMAEDADIDAELAEIRRLVAGA